MNKRSARRSYSDDDRANALAALKANDQNFQRTARELGLPRKNLQNWAKGQKGLPAVAQRLAPVAHQKEQDLAAKLEALPRQLLEMLPSKIEGATLTQLMTAVGIAIDKALLLRKQPLAGPDGSASSPTLTPDEGSTFFSALGQVLAPYPEAKQAVGDFLENLLAKAKAAAPVNGQAQGL